MVEERIAYGIEKFLEEDFFLPENDSYCLEEKSESGRSELQVTIQGDNFCCEDYDHKGKCNFLKRESLLKLQRSVDHVLLQKKDGKWILHLIEMKSKVDDKKWHEIKQKRVPAILMSAHWNGCLGYILMRLRYIQPMKLLDFGIRSKAKIRKSLYHFLENRCHQSRRANGRIIESVWMLEKSCSFIIMP